MLQNYFKTAWRSLLRGRLFSLLNIAGLAVGMAGSLLILLWLQNEVSFDRFHINKNNLYEVYALSGSTDGQTTVIPESSQPLAAALKQSFSEVQAATRVQSADGFLLTAGNKSYTNLKGSFVDPSFLSMFSFPLLEGSKDGQLKNSYSVSITESLAERLFGKERAIGKIIRIDSVDNFTVTGVLKGLPSNTRFDFEYLLPWSYYNKISRSNSFETEAWLSNNTSTFVLLNPGVNITAFNEKIKDLTRQHTGRNDVWTHFVFPLSQWHLYSDFENGKPAGGRIETVRVFGIIALFILLIACINFINLNTARSEQRAKEVGIRKVAGAGRGLLIGQFISEAFLSASIAGTVALLLIQAILPIFNTLVSTQIEVPYNSVGFWFCIAGFIIITSLLAGSYPAFYLSSFQPAGIFKKQFRKVNAAITPRKILVVVQFTFAVVLIVSTVVIRNQVVYAQNRDKGYSNNNLVQVNFVGDIDRNYALIRQDLISTGVASSVTKTMAGLIAGGTHTWGLRWQGEAPKDTNTTITLFSADAGLVKTAGLQLLQGRDLDIDKYPQDSFSVLLNETAVKLVGFKDPVGQTIYQPYANRNLQVVGVVKDYITGSPYKEIPPVVIEGSAAGFSALNIKFSPAHSTADNLAAAEQIFKKYNPAYPFDYQFADAEYARQFRDEQNIKTLAGLFAVLSIFICCLGLFGLSAYVAESRIKEIGVRKVLGATVFNITALLSFEFIKPVIVSIGIATPVAYYTMSKWLSGYSYRIQLDGGIFLLSGLAAVGIALITVSFQSVKAATANPVKSLRTE